MAEKKGVNVLFNPVFKDLDLGRGKPVVQGEALGDESSGFRKVLSHPNEADVKMQRLLDQNGKK